MQTSADNHASEFWDWVCYWLIGDRLNAGCWRWDLQFLFAGIYRWGMIRSHHVQPHGQHKNNIVQEDGGAQGQDKDRTLLCIMHCLCYGFVVFAFTRLFGKVRIFNIISSRTEIVGGEGKAWEIMWVGFWIATASWWCLTKGGDAGAPSRSTPMLKAVV